MEKYYLLDHDKVLIECLNLQKYLAYFTSFVSLALLVAYIFSKKFIFVFLFWFLLFEATLFIFLSILSHRMAGRKISVTDCDIELYTVNGKLIRSYPISSMSVGKEIVLFRTIRYGPIRKMECLIFYRDIELYKDMEYGEYCYDKNMLIIQNPELISKLEYLIDRPMS